MIWVPQFGDLEKASVALDTFRIHEVMKYLRLAFALSDVSLLGSPFR